MNAADLPSLSTERLELRPPDEHDAERLCAFAVENREHLAPWEPLRSDEYFTLEHWKEEAASLQRRAWAGTGISFMLLPRECPEGPVLGRATLSNIVRGAFQAAHLGYALDHREQGRGLMREALVAVTAFAFGQLGLHRVMANYMPTNERSAHLLRRLGFVPEGYARDYLLLAGRWQDHVLTSLIAPSSEP
jgi:ribosomal-protein-alanine N-acetyltransferase